MKGEHDICVWKVNKKYEEEKKKEMKKKKQRNKIRKTNQNGKQHNKICVLITSNDHDHPQKKSIAQQTPWHHHHHHHHHQNPSRSTDSERVSHSLNHAPFWKSGSRLGFQTGESPTIGTEPGIGLLLGFAFRDAFIIRVQTTAAVWRASSTFTPTQKMLAAKGKGL